MSKQIKNPELYIKRLKKQIERLEEEQRDEKLFTDGRIATLQDKIQRAKGELVTTWEKYEGEQNGLGTFHLATLRPGDCIAIIGKVKRVESWVEKGRNNKRSRIVYDILETRKIE